MPGLHDPPMAGDMVAVSTVTTDDLLRLPAFDGADAESVRGTDVHLAHFQSASLVRVVDATGVTVASIVEAASTDVPDGPVIRLRPGVPSWTAYEATMTALVERSRIAARRSRFILQSLTDAELHGRSLDEIVALLAELVGNPVSLKDPDFRVLAWSGDDAAMDEARHGSIAAGRISADVLRILQRRGDLTRIREERRPFRMDAAADVGMGPRVVCPVKAGTVHFGHLSISEGGRRLDALDLLAVESGATVIAFHVSRQRAVESSVRDQRALLLYQLVFARGDLTTDTWRRHAAMLGLDADVRFVVALLAFDARESGIRDLGPVVATVDTALERMGVRPSLAVAETDTVVVVLPDDAGDLPATMTAVMREVAAYHRVPPMWAGISTSRPGSDGLGQCYEEARTAVNLGRTMHGAGSVTRYAELGVLRLLSEIDEDVLERHLDSVLGPDAGFREQFRETFGALVEAGFNKAEAARRMYVHVNTLKYRLGRITRVTGQDPRSHHGRFALETALRLLELQRARRSTS